MNAVLWTVTVVIGLPLTGAAVVALVWLFQPATGPGKHQPGGPDETTRATLVFRRAIAAVRRERAVPAAIATAGAATTLLTPPDSTPVLEGRMLSEVRAEHDAQRHADAMHAGYGRAVDRLRTEAGLPTVDEMRGEYFALPVRTPGATLPYVAPLVDRGPDHPPWPTGAMPVYGQAPQLVVEPELARRVIA